VAARFALATGYLPMRLRRNRSMLGMTPSDFFTTSQDDSR